MWGGFISCGAGTGQVLLSSPDSGGTDSQGKFLGTHRKVELKKKFLTRWCRTLSCKFSTNINSLLFLANIIQIESHGERPRTLVFDLRHFLKAWALGTVIQITVANSNM